MGYGLDTVMITQHVRPLLWVRFSLVTLLLVGLFLSGNASESSQTQRFNGFRLDLMEVSVAQFRAFMDARKRPTTAERNGGGSEYVGGWIQRPGWHWNAPYGRPAADDEPAVHITWFEAREYCEWRGGRLPTTDEWSLAAYTETRETPTDGFVHGRRYVYPVGSEPVGMNTSDDDPWPRHAPVGRTRMGVNGLYDMGANVWEWLAQDDGERALTAGGSWWYGAYKTRFDGFQFKPKGFAAVYIGFRCAYDL